MKLELPNDLLSTKQAARLLDLHIGTIRRWIIQRRLRGWRVGGRWKVSRADLLDLPKPTEGPEPELPMGKRERERHNRQVYEQLKARGLV